ncbi:MAG: prepilin peptidase [Bdellovibrionales bacterium]
MLLAVYFLFTLTLVVIIIIDLRQQIIPDYLNAVVALLGALHLFLYPYADYLLHGMSAVALGGIGYLLAGPYSRWRKRDMLGWGDVKFMAAAGLWMPLYDIGWFLALAGGCGIIGSLIYKYRTGRAETPFAPALCIALWLMVAHDARYILSL